MRNGLPPVLAPAAALALGALFGACGSQTKTVSAAGAPPAPATTASSAHSTVPTSTSQAPSSTAPAQTTTAGGTPAPSQARTAPEPAFVQPQQTAEGLSSASAVLRANGFIPADTSEYHPNQVLRVLVGVRSGSSDGYAQQAFFFVNGRFIGTDSSQPSATVKVVSQGETEVTLAYPLYRRGDPLGSPSGGQARVRFQLNNGKLIALDAIPSASPTATLSRQ
jgi:LppP/LprE lipoprotein